MAAQMIRRTIALLALCAALLILVASPGAAQSEQLRISVSDTRTLADGGSVQVTIRLAVDAAGADATITLTSDLGAFGAESGPSRVIVRPLPAADGDDLVANVTLVGDGRPGLAVVTARVGLMVDAVTVAFIGAPAEIAILRPAPDHPLDASRSHVVQIEVRDRLGQPVPGAPLRLEAASEDDDPILRAADGERGSLLALRTSERGRVNAAISAEPGAATLRTVSVDAEAELALTFHGEPVSLRLWALTPVMERGSETAAAIVVARLLDAGGRAVPGQRVAFAAEDDSGIRLTADGELDELITDSAGGVLVQATTDSALSGEYWLRADASESGLSDVIELTVVGAPETIYVTATEADSLEGAEDEVQEYVLRAEVVDATGRLSASGYTVRWRVVLEDAVVELTPENSIVRGGVATSRLRIEYGDGADAEAPVLQAWLIENPQEVASSGLLADLASSGLALARGMNVVTWIGADKPIADAIAPIGHLEVTVWRQHPEGAGWQVYTTRRDVPGSEGFEVANGDRLHIRVDAAARLPGATR